MNHALVLAPAQPASTRRQVPLAAWLPRWGLEEPGEDEEGKTMGAPHRVGSASGDQRCWDAVPMPAPLPATE